jgi:hypothetical protein
VAFLWDQVLELEPITRNQEATTFAPDEMPGDTGTQAFVSVDALTTATRQI